MLTPAFTGIVIAEHQELGPVTLIERRGHMAVIRTARGVTFICNAGEASPQAVRAEVPADCEPA